MLEKLIIIKTFSFCLTSCRIELTETSDIKRTERREMIFQRLDRDGVSLVPGLKVFLIIWQHSARSQSVSKSSKRVSVSHNNEPGDSMLNSRSVFMLFYSFLSINGFILRDIDRLNRVKRDL